MNRRTALRIAVVMAGQLALSVGLSAAPGDEVQIRAARAAMNDAFAAHDIQKMMSFMTDTLTFSGPAWRLVGKPQLQTAHEQYWKGRPDSHWDYEPSEILPFNAWHWLSERGTWDQKWTAADGPTELKGTYLAFWKEVDGKWMLDAHLFVTTSCTPVERAFCKRDTARPVASR